MDALKRLEQAGWRFALGNDSLTGCTTPLQPVAQPVRLWPADSLTGCTTRTACSTACQAVAGNDSLTGCTTRTACSTACSTAC